VTLDSLLLEVRERRLILISPDEIWPSPHVTQELHKAMRKHRQGLALLMRWSSVDTCPARALHRQYFKYVGNGNYVCTICQQIAV